jgi:hypothetical protein
MNFGLDVSSINVQDCEGIPVKAEEVNAKNKKYCCAGWR